MCKQSIAILLLCHWLTHHRYRGTRQLSQPKRSYKQQQQQHHPQSSPSPMSHRQQQMNQSGGGGGGRTGSSSQGGGDTLIVYHLDDFPTPFAKRLGGGDITLSDFKEKVFLRKGDYRWAGLLAGREGTPVISDKDTDKGGRPLCSGGGGRESCVLCQR